MSLSCPSGWEHTFCSSKKTNPKGFEVNKRIVYSMRSCGQGYAGIENFMTLMNLLPPMARKTYNNLAEKVKDAVRKVAEETMQAAADEIRENALVEDEESFDTAIYCDGIW